MKNRTKRIRRSNCGSNKIRKHRTGKRGDRSGHRSFRGKPCRRFLHKYEAIGKEATWHFIGTLQSRKVKQIIDDVDYIHSLDRLSLAEEIDKRANRTIKCFVQVNVSGEQSKHGLAPEDVLPFIETLSAFHVFKLSG